MKPKDIGEYHLPRMLRSALGSTLTVGLAYAVVAKICYETTTLPGHIAPIFPSAGIALAARIILGPSGLFGVWLGSFSYNLILLYQGSGSLYGRAIDLVVVAIVGIGAMSSAGAGGWLVRHFCKGEYPLKSARNVAVLVAVGAFGGCLLSSLIGVCILSLAGAIPFSQLGVSWLTWWVGDTAGTIIMAPLILSWFHRQPARLNSRRTVEAITLGGLTLLLCYFGFFLKTHFEYFLTPLLFWAVFRFGVRGASSLAATIAIFATVGTSQGGGPFILGTVNESLLYLYSYLAVTVIGALLLAGLLDERKRAGNALTEQKALLQTLVNHLPIAVYLKDSAGRKILTNPLDLAYLGVASEAEVLGKTDFDFFPPEAAAKTLADEQKVFASGQPQLNQEDKVSHSDGSVHWFLNSKVPLFDSAGSVTGLAGIGLDITARKLAEAELDKYRDHLQELVAARTAELVQARDTAETAYQKLRKLEKLRDDLVHMVVHDMRSPLAGLEMFFDLLSPEEVQAPDFQENLNLMRKTSRALSDMVTSLLDVSRLEAGQMPLHCQTGDFGQLINAAMHRLSGLTQGRKIAVHTPAPPVLAYCDPVITDRIIQNLLGNALKFTPTEGSIRLEIVAEEPWARLSITDTGSGIPIEYHEKVFEKFGQVEVRKERQTPSSGLGLAFCKLATEAQGGSIQLESEPGRGSTFHVRLPQTAPEGKKK